MNEEYIKFTLKQALKLARDGKGRCSPNPAVGAICLSNKGMLSGGFHRKAGEQHAEVMALDALSADMTKGASLFVTLEPCNHYGKTPPCVNKIIKAKVAEVFYAYRDPNQQATGGADELQKAGIKCTHVPVTEIDYFYRSYTHWLKTQKPWMTFKIAMSFDGKIAGANKEQIQISDEKTLPRTMQGRREADAILTTMNTVINDNPKLNVRANDKIIAKPVYIIDSQARLPLNLNLCKTAETLTIFYVSTPESENNKNALAKRGVNCVAVSSDHGRCDLHEVINYLGKQGYHDVWIEAGGILLEAMLAQRLIQDLVIYPTRRVLGSDCYPALSAGFDFIEYWQTGLEQSDGALVVSVSC